MSTPEEVDRDALISQLSAVTGTSGNEASSLLSAHDWKVDLAAATYFEMQAPEEEEQAAVPASSSAAAAAASTQSSGGGGGGQTLSGSTIPSTLSDRSNPSTGTSRQNQSQKSRGGLRTLRDLQKESSSRADGGGNDSDDDNDGEQDLYAGGEKSGLAVQNPDTAADQFNEMLDRARRNLPRPPAENPQEPSSHFTGTGVTLGGDDAPSQIIADPNASSQRSSAPAVERILHLWQDGFSVDDGPLFRYDDPANARMLAMINSGRAPLSILNVEHDQEVDLKVHERRREKYTKPKPKYKPFSGAGQRLGSPVPGLSTATTTIDSATAATSPSFSSVNAGAQAPSQSDPSTSVDESQPTVSLQIRLGDGTRLQSRFNTTHTVGDVYAFVDRARPGSGAGQQQQQRAYALMTTFPSKELSDRSVQLGEMAEFKRGGVVVQKWT